MAEAMLVAMVIPADGPSFGVAPSGTWMWMIPVLEDAVVYAQQVDVRLDVFQCDDSRLLHHVTQIAGKCQLACLATC